MFCPICGINQTEDLKFCNKCGANLQAVRQAAASRETEEKFDWNKTWLTEMFLSESERKRRKIVQEIERGITPEVKRFNEIKGGVITTCAALGLMIFLYVLMQGIILGGKADPGAGEVLSRIWCVAFIPFLVGIGLIINGSFVSRKLVETMKQNQQATPFEISGKTTDQSFLNPADTSESIPADFSVVDNTTDLLKTPVNYKK